MHTVTFRIRGISPYSQSRPIQTQKAERETSIDHENRVWRERCHANENGEMIIPPMALKNCLSETAKFLSIQVPGKGKATYTKHFEAGVMAAEESVVRVKGQPVMIHEVKGETLFVPADGVRGGSKRVHKVFPYVQGWSANCEIMVLDEMITESVLALHLTRAGQYIGIGRFRPRRNGYYGRFLVEDIKWQTADITQLAA